VTTRKSLTAVVVGEAEAVVEAAAIFSSAEISLGCGGIATVAIAVHAAASPRESDEIFMVYFVGGLCER
jgi:hypothetical protein